jgi:hypothetical protein
LAVRRIIAIGHVLEAKVVSYPRHFATPTPSQLSEKGQQIFGGYGSGTNAKSANWWLAAKVEYHRAQAASHALLEAGLREKVEY